MKQVPGASPETVIDEQAMFAAVNALELHRWREAAELPFRKFGATGRTLLIGLGRSARRESTILRGLRPI